jgi:hypothetical protein
MRKLSLAAVGLSMILLILNVSLYDKLQQFIPVIRGLEAETTYILALRVLVINILSLTAFLVPTKSIHRSHQLSDLNRFGGWVLMFIMFKMSFEFLGLFYREFLEMQMYLLLAGMAALLIYGVMRHGYLFTQAFWKKVSFNTSEKILFISLLLLYLAVNVPAVFAGMNQ